VQDDGTAIATVAETSPTGSLCTDVAWSPDGTQLWRKRRPQPSGKATDPAWCSAAPDDPSEGTFVLAGRAGPGRIYIRPDDEQPSWHIGVHGDIEPTAARAFEDRVVAVGYPCTRPSPRVFPRTTPLVSRQPWIGLLDPQGAFLGDATLQLEDTTSEGTAPAKACPTDVAGEDCPETSLDWMPNDVREVQGGPLLVLGRRGCDGVFAAALEVGP